MKLKLALITVILLCSCANSYKIAVEEKVNVLDYDIFVFRLCEKTNMLGNDRFFLCDVDCKTAAKTLERKNTIVSEELYLLVSRTTDDVIYLTTKTNRSFDKTPNIFNTEAHEDYVLINDLENVYYGKKTKERIVFSNKSEILTFYYNPNTKFCKIAIESILSNSKENNEIKNKTVVLNKIYNVPVEFNMTNRALAIQVKNSNTYEFVDTIELTKDKIRFDGKINFIELSKRRRLKYHPRFND